MLANCTVYKNYDGTLKNETKKEEPKKEERPRRVF
jgi:hypothetical protein